MFVPRPGIARTFRLRGIAALPCALALLLAASCGGDSGEPPLPPDPLEAKARAVEGWFQRLNVTAYGGVGYAHLAHPEGDEVERFSVSDSTIWTGTCLAAAALRYAVTGEAEAREHALRAVGALDAHLRVTGVPGFIARFAGPDEPPWNRGYPEHRRYVRGTGAWEGSFWINNTSRDQYTGWFFGMALAYDLIDDPEMRRTIRAAVREVVDKVAADGYVILGEDGRPTDAGPEVLPQMRLAWHLIAAHVLDEPAAWRAYEERFAQDGGLALEVGSFSFFNKYFQYYTFNLLHQTYFNLLRLERDPVRRARYLEVFHDQVRLHVEDTHNVFFDAIYLSQCARAGECRRPDEVRATLRPNLELFQDPPVRRVALELPPAEVDPLSEALTRLIEALGLDDLLSFSPQALEPRPVDQRCPSSFMWQKSPYELECSPGDGSLVYPGIDFMVAYWLGRYYDLIEPGNRRGILWPEDDS